MTNPGFGFAEHQCKPLERTILIPITVEAYAAKRIATAHCQVCGQREFERAVDHSVEPSKGYYVTV